LYYITIASKTKKQKKKNIFDAVYNTVALVTVKLASVCLLTAVIFLSIFLVLGKLFFFFFFPLASEKHHLWQVVKTKEMLTWRVELLVMTSWHDSGSRWRQTLFCSPLAACRSLGFQTLGKEQLYPYKAAIHPLQTFPPRPPFLSLPQAAGIFTARLALRTLLGAVLVVSVYVDETNRW